MRSLRIGLVIAALLALLPAEGGAAPARRGTRAGCGKPTRVHAFHVEAVWTKEVYRTSEKAVVTVTVTRPAHEDPVELGIPLPVEPPVTVPVQDAYVTTAIITKAWPPPFGIGYTDANGQLTLKIPLKAVEPGPQVATNYATKWTNQGGCPDIEEWGFIRQDPAFKVIP